MFVLNIVCYNSLGTNWPEGWVRTDWKWVRNVWAWVQIVWVWKIHGHETTGYWRLECQTLNNAINKQLSSLTHWPLELFAKMLFWTFLRFSGWIRAKLAPIYSEKHLQHDSTPFFRLASRFLIFLLGHVHKSKLRGKNLDKKVTYVFTLFDFCISFSPVLSLFFLFAALIDLLLGLLPIQKILRKHHHDMQFLSWSTWPGNFALSFSLITFWAFLCISQAPLDWSLWFGMKVEHGWCQFWSKVMASELQEWPRLANAGYGRHNGL